MDREEIKNGILEVVKGHPNILLTLPTSYGKSRIALDIVYDRYQNPKVLIVIPKLVLIETWNSEIIKWYGKEYLRNFTYVTYVSYPKIDERYDVVIYDECHHLSERCLDNRYRVRASCNILLSATVSFSKFYDLKLCFSPLFVHKITVKKAIEEDILPSPKILLVPLHLDNTNVNQEIILNKSKKNSVTVSYRDRWSYMKDKSKKVIIKCTELEYYTYISNLITYYKNKIFMERFKNLYLRSSGDRLKWLSSIKVPYIAKILDILNNERTLTFCNSIQQTEQLGTYCINSKNKSSAKNLIDFNSKTINHITACGILDEGVNLTECRIGIFAAINSSDRLIVQKTGRILRHSNPVIIMPYYVNTREEEIINQLGNVYDKNLIKTIKLEDLKDVTE